MFIRVVSVPTLIGFLICSLYKSAGSENVATSLLTSCLNRAVVNTTVAPTGDMHGTGLTKHSSQGVWQNIIETRKGFSKKIICHLKNLFKYYCQKKC